MFNVNKLFFRLILDSLTENKPAKNDKTNFTLKLIFESKFKKLIQEHHTCKIDRYRIYISLQLSNIESFTDRAARVSLCTCISDQSRSSLNAKSDLDAEKGPTFVPHQTWVRLGCARDQLQLLTNGCRQARAISKVYKLRYPSLGQRREYVIGTVLIEHLKRTHMFCYSYENVRIYVVYCLKNIVFVKWSGNENLLILVENVMMIF